MSANPIEILNTSEWLTRTERSSALRSELRTLQVEQREIIEASLRIALRVLRWGFDEDGVYPLDQPAIDYCDELARKCFEQEIYSVTLLGSDVVLVWSVVDLGAQGELILDYGLRASRPDHFIRGVEALCPPADFEQIKERLAAARAFTLQVNDKRFNLVHDLAQAVRRLPVERA